MKKSDGFTLIEVLASIVILGLLLTSFFQFFIFSQQTTVKNREKLVAINIAQDVLEQVITNTYPEIVEDSKIPSTIYPKTYLAQDTCIQSDINKKTDCLQRYKKAVDQKNYSIQVNVGVKRVNNLRTIEVKVFRDDGTYMSSVKGVVEL